LKSLLVVLVLALGCVYPVPHEKVWVHPQGGGERPFLEQAHACTQATRNTREFDACMMDEGWEQLLITGRTTTRRKASIPVRTRRIPLIEACKPGVLVCRPGVCSCYTNINPNPKDNPYGDESWKMRPSRAWQRWEDSR
jgi:hypothetical protein